MHESDFKIALICALPVEMDAIKGMLDETYEDLPQREGDSNTYLYGRIGKHNVVVACLPAGATGTSSATHVATNFRRSFRELKWGLLVGIGGGVPSYRDIRLGDVVVSKPHDRFPGVVKYDMGKTVQDGHFIQTGSLNRPPNELLTAVSRLEAEYMREDSDIPRYLSEMIRKYPSIRPESSYQVHENDQLFEASYDHAHIGETCNSCDHSRLVLRTERTAGPIVVHYGTIASGDQVMRHGPTRDRVASGINALCFEMEAAGLMNTLPCLVIRGISDYADSHKNKQWQPYAASTAAAYAKDLLCIIPADEFSTPAETQLYMARDGVRNEPIPDNMIGIQAECWKKPRGCSCCCHSRLDFPGRFTSLKLPAWLALGSICDVKSCNSRHYTVSFRSALTRLGVPLAVEFWMAFSGYSICPSLTWQPCRPYLSPGFKILWEFQNYFLSDTDQIIFYKNASELQDLCDQRFHTLRTLFVNGTVRFEDVDPAGATWLEKTIQVPWSPQFRDYQWKLLTFLCQNHPSGLKQNPRLLFDTFKWIGEGPHMHLLKILLELGLDPSSMDVQLFRKWPSLSDPNWLGESITEDPFAVEFMRNCIECPQTDPEFANTVAFLERVLVGSQSELEEMLEKCPKPTDLESLRNALGHSALHLSILKPRRLRFLLEQGFDPDPPDHGGTTPLMYAAAYGEPESVLALLDFGANPSLVDKRNQRQFLHYAVLREHWNVFEATAEWLRSNFEETSSSSHFATSCLAVALALRQHLPDDTIIEQARDLGADFNAIYGDKSLMHLARWPEEGHKILDYGFQNVSARDVNGETVLMSTMRMRDPRISARLLQIDSDIVNKQDNVGRTALHHCLVNVWCDHGPPYSHTDWSSRSETFAWRIQNLETLAVLQSHGIRIWIKDNCECFCAPNGCSALSALLHFSAHNSYRSFRAKENIFPCLVDWYVSIKATGVHENELRTVEQIRRFREAQESGSPHTCCRGQTREHKQLFGHFRGESNRSPRPVRVTIDESDIWNCESTSVDYMWSEELAKFYELVFSISSRAYERAVLDSIASMAMSSKPAFDGIKVDYKNDEITSTTSSSSSARRPTPPRVDVDSYRAWTEECWKRGAFANLPRGNDWWYDTTQRLTSMLEREFEKIFD